ncbi:hypothetical protein AM493_07625 [Flavobacterium akiainvivens]|uniref:Cytochrome oxidase complex assembly protein 1 n=1 Tax=Flavobacterium akiainvivens TaxID=1202724 RepID=A0A0M8MAC9_9FLAO|nr:cytochrome c oxidase assembly factor Coa1 family protein [Flavobacterium akiainvivens]KOS05915.1 hypothetical protein AM493_07625 [Flavobacterium akiainvivens]SFQ53187.1 Cytochrome oxidase complex assembly protein 1 [Flavobacterium akiainvivens]
MQNSQHFESYKNDPQYIAYRQKQRKKTIKILSIVIPAVLLAATGFVFLVMGIIKNTDAYQTAVREIKNNKEVIEATGGVEGFGVFPTGSVQTSNDSGSAQLSITVKGTQHDAEVYVELTKDPVQDWQVTRLEVGN